jgi:hypothetical protein
VKSRVLLASLLSGALLLGVFAGGVLRPSRPVVAPPRDQPVVTAAGDSPEGGSAPISRPRTVESAREAALAYASASQQWLYLEEGALEGAIRGITTPAAAERLVRQTVGEVAVARDALVHAAGPVWWFVRPLASRVTVDEDRAEASVWLVTVLSAADVALPQADWLTLDLELVWRSGGWLLDSIEDRPGPTPMSGVRDEPWRPEPFDEALHGFERVGSEVPE